MSTHRFITVITLSLIVGASFAAPASGWDCQRKGFVAGLGIGATPAAHLERNARDYSATHTGVSGQILLGYAFTENWLLAYDANLAFVRPDFTDTYSLPGVRCLSVYWYPGVVGRTFFVVGGVGRILSQGASFDGSVDNGWGYQLGAGYEPIPHLQIGAYYFGGSTSDNDFDSRDDVLNLLVTVVGY